MKDIDDLVSKLQVFINTAWENLQKEFNIKCNHEFLFSKDIILKEFQDCNVSIPYHPENVNGKKININIFPILQQVIGDIDSMMWVGADFTKGENGSLIISNIKLYINNDYLMQSILSVMDDYYFDFEKWKNKIQLTLRHEMGHVLDLTRGSRQSKTYDENNEADMEYILSRSNLDNRICDIEFGEYNIEYYSLSYEKIANDYVGLTPQDMIDASF